MKKIAIIGAGPAGIYSALLLKKFSGEIHIFEQNKNLGEKLKITGGGRMNVTNKEFSNQHFSSSAPNILKNIFKSPWIKKREEILKELGISYKWENNRALLSSESAIKEVKRLGGLLEKQKNCIIQNLSTVNSIQKKDSGFSLEYINNDRSFLDTFSHVIIASGAMFRLFDMQNTGNKDGIYRLITELNHSITTVSPSLTAFEIEDNPFLSLAGLSLSVSIWESKPSQFMNGDLLFTHKGLSGPVILDFSSLLQKDSAFISFLPSSTLEVFKKEIQDPINNKLTLSSFLQKYFPKRFTFFLLEISDITNTERIAELSKKKLQNILNTIFQYPINNLKKGNYTHAWTTQGGVDLKEIIAHRFESKIYPQLFFAGEVLDINGLCGGYNISFCAISAKIISEAILEK